MDLSSSNTSWATPEAEVDLPRTVTASVSIDVAGLTPPPRSSRPLPGSPVDRLQPRSVSQLLDAGFEVVRFRARTIAAVAAVLFLPLYALPAVLISRALDSSSAGSLSLFSGRSSLLNAGGGLSEGFWRTVTYGLAGQAGLLIANLLLGVAIAHLVTSWMVGRDPSIGETLRHVGRRSGVALIAWIALLPIKALSALPCYLGLLYTLPVFAVLAAVVSVEGSGPFRSIARTHRMAVRRYGPFLGMWALWVVAGGALSQSSALLVSLTGHAFDGAAVSWIVTSSMTMIFTIVFACVEVAAWSMAYVDLRIRTEGIDLAFEIDREFTRVSA